MSGITNNGRVPRLRFPEFRGAEPWKVNRFDEVLSPVVRERPKPAETYLGLGLRSHGKGTFLKLLEDPAKNSMDQLYEVKANDLIVNITFAWEGAVAIAKERDEGALVSHRFPTYTFEKGRTTPGFFRYFILDKQFVYNLGVISPGGAGRNRVMSKNDFMKLQVALPSPAEQQKIAECLSSLDDLITLEAQKLDSLKAHKKGLMQQLFPREGETQPRLRFPEFENAGEWEDGTLDDIATFRRGSFPQPYGLPEWYDEKNGMPFIQVFDVGDDFRLKGKTKNRISKLAAEKSVFIPEGTLIVTLQGSIGRVAITHYDAYIDRTLLIFESFRKPIEKIFFARVIQNLFDIEKEQAPGGIIKTITKEALSEFKVKFPTIDEQHRIASCLTSLDDLITAQTQKLEALKTHKKGLMQQLFPQVSEE